MQVEGAILGPRLEACKKSMQLHTKMSVRGVIRRKRVKNWPEPDTIAT